MRLASRDRDRAPTGADPRTPGRGRVDSPDAHDALRRAVAAAEKRSVRRGRAADSPPAARAGSGLAADRWTLIDHFESDGRRFLLAVENRPASSLLLRLSVRELEVLHHALRGANNKEIGSDLGLSYSTVHVLIWRAANKLGVRTRAKLIAVAARLLQPLESPPPQGELARRA